MNFHFIFIVLKQVNVMADVIISMIHIKELIDKGVYDKEFDWNPSNCEWKCDKLCDVGESSDYKNCKCRKKLIT